MGLPPATSLRLVLPSGTRFSLRKPSSLGIAGPGSGCIRLPIYDAVGHFWVVGRIASLFHQGSPNPFAEYMVNRSKVILLLVEAIDLYLLGTVTLVFGSGLYELFVCNLDFAKTLSEGGDRRTSNLFSIFTLKERPKWLEIKSVDELKTKLEHVIVIFLLIGLFDKSKKAAISGRFALLFGSSPAFVRLPLSVL